MIMECKKDDTVVKKTKFFQLIIRFYLSYRKLPLKNTEDTLKDQMGRF
jgi:hypothetical protein